MLRALYSLSEQFWENNIYVWGIDRDSVNLFTNLAYHEINVHGFVDLSKRHVGKYFMNRPIIHEGMLSKNKDIVIIPIQGIKKDIQKKFPQIRFFYAREIIGLNKKLRNKKIILYGIGYRGTEIYTLLQNAGIEIEAACVSEKRQDVWNGKKVYSVDELQADSDTVIVIATYKEAYKEDMLKRLRKYDCAMDKYVDEMLDIFSIGQGDMFQIINKANVENREIYLYGNNSDEEQFIEYILKIYNISIRDKIYKNEIEEFGIKNIYELMYGSIGNKTVIVAVREPEESEKVCGILDQIGFSLENHDYTALFPKAKVYVNAMETITDCLNGHTVRGNGKMSGYVVYGNEQEADLRILILGGSTSTDGYYRPVTWVRRFFKKLQNEGKRIFICNGAACGYDSVQELLCLMRDGKYIKPDYVISLSGVNDTEAKLRANNQFCVGESISWIHALAPKREYYSGIQRGESLYEFWYRNTQIMKMVSELYGARFYSFLQPMNAAKDNADLFEIGMHERESLLENTRIFRQESKKNNSGLFKNLIDLFDEETGMFIDQCHYSDKGNEVIADIVFNAVLEDIRDD